MASFTLNEMAGLPPAPLAIRIFPTSVFDCAFSHFSDKNFGILTNHTPRAAFWHSKSCSVGPDELPILRLLSSCILYFLFFTRLDYFSPVHLELCAASIEHVCCHIIKNYK